MDLKKIWKKNCESIAAGREGRKSLLISNAIYLSSWDKKMIEIPELDSQKELQFEKEFEIALSLKK
ncbi:hypothetical protein [Oribacterium sp. NK2B42]|uniref:hypothetical protein n=1 Tax=Oribacterium sp. NK2B42 TaxID=689781 RepID=UPI0003F5660D|nr:hypothetical protein [Oribacterium sp. NK2B42]